MMRKLSESKPGRFARAMRMGFAGLSVLAGSAALSTGCLDRPVVESKPRTSNVFVDQIKQTAIDKIDLLFVIDNSVSMADKQTILAAAVPELLERLINPICVSAADPNVTQPGPGAEVDCPSGFNKEFNAVGDIHIGVVSSSLGGFGGTFCTPAAGTMSWNATQNDKGHLIGTVREADHPGLKASTWNGSGFLAWDLAGKKSPPGDTNAATIKTKFTDMVQATGESGCGFEATLEAWYRFLIDPNPPANVFLDTEKGVTAVEGRDDTLLAQRAAFLRPDSLVAIIMLSDENDCSVRLAGSGWAVSTSGAFRMPRATSACAADPNDKCCRPCGASQPAEGCPSDASDSECVKGKNLTDKEDALNLRCYDQKRRFGFGLLYPTDRYVNGLRSTIMLDGNGNPIKDGEDNVVNPLYASSGTAPRDPSFVFLAGIVGVPWQDIATDASLSGPGLTYLTADELATATPNRWDVILGNSATNTKPTDPLMIETPNTRSGSNPITGDAIVTWQSPLTNPINGHDYDNSEEVSDLQYACIFPLDSTRDCSGEDPPSGCDCEDGFVARNSPLCYNPATNAGPSTTQYQAKAYPGLRHLQVLKDYGTNSIVASICPKVTSPTSDPSFGYNPAVGAIISRLKEVLSGRCLPRELDADPMTDEVPCSVIEATGAAQGPCNCAARQGRDSEPLDDATIKAIQKKLQEAGACGGVGQDPCSTFCLCRIQQSITPQCLQNVDDDGSVSGYCYIDPFGDPAVGNPALVENCGPTEKRLLRFVGEDTPVPGAITFIACAGGSTR